MHPVRYGKLGFKFMLYQKLTLEGFCFDVKKYKYMKWILMIYHIAISIFSLC